jgi:hypothetical protein
LLFVLNYNNRLESITNDLELSSIVIPYNIDVRNINISLNNPLNFLTLEEKLQLYQYLIEQERFYKINNNNNDTKTTIELLKKEKLEKENFNIADYFNSGQFYQSDLVFIGRRDYNKYVRGTNLENRVIRSNKISKNYLDISKIDKNDIFTHKELKKLNDVVFKQNQSEKLNKEEIFLIQEQLAVCYKDAIIRNKSNIVAPISIEFSLNKDGYINTKKIKMTIIDKNNKYSGSEYNTSINIIKTAIILCNPLKNLPLLKYKSWKNVNFVFSKTGV